MFIEMEVKTVVIGGGPVSSLIVLQPTQQNEDEPLNLPIRIGSVEATAISMGVNPDASARPMTHDLLKSVIESLGSHLRSVLITDVSGTTFYAQLDLINAGGHEVRVDCRPSDAIALAVRCNVPTFAERAVLRTAAMPDFGAIEDQEHNQEMQDFHEFVEGLTPDDFNVTDGGGNTPQK